MKSEILPMIGIFGLVLLFILGAVSFELTLLLVLANMAAMIAEGVN